MINQKDKTNIINQRLNLLIGSDKIQRILTFVANQRQHKLIYPNSNDIFRALKLSPLAQTKVVIFGQDPYHSFNVADGLAFSTRSSLTPPSLKNIFQELRNEYPNIIIETNDLSYWANQGILLLNTILTVENAKPLSHKDIGWDYFIFEIIKIINEELFGIIFLLWGKEAQKLEKYIDRNKHIILKSSHPSPFSYNYGFKNNNHFKMVNEILIKQNKEPIDWNLKRIINLFF